MIPLSVPNISGNELKYVKKCLESGWISTAGQYVKEFEESFSTEVGVAESVSTMNGTAALHLSLTQIVKQNSVILMPNITFVATANAISYTGAEPIFIDAEEEGWQMDLDILEQFLEEDCIQEGKKVFHKKTNKLVAGIMIVHVQGNVCDISRLLQIVEKYNLPLIEDAAEALGSKYKNQHAGTFGDFGCYSFNGNKIISTGGGGMVVARSSDDLSKLRHLATTAKTDPLRYYHDEVGYNYRLVNILSAIGLAQLEQLDKFVKRKQEISEIYKNELKDIKDISFQKISKDVESNQWLFTIRTSRMNDLLFYLNDNGVMSRPFWAPMNKLPMYKDRLFITRNNISNKLHESALSLPCSTNITNNELEIVVKSIRKFFS